MALKLFALGRVCACVFCVYSICMFKRDEGTDYQKIFILTFVCMFVCVCVCLHACMRVCVSSCAQHCTPHVIPGWKMESGSKFYLHNNMVGRLASFTLIESDWRDPILNIVYKAGKGKAHQHMCALGIQATIYLK